MGKSPEEYADWSPGMRLGLGFSVRGLGFRVSGLWLIIKFGLYKCVNLFYTFAYYITLFQMICRLKCYWYIIIIYIYIYICIFQNLYLN